MENRIGDTIDTPDLRLHALTQPSLGEQRRVSSRWALRERAELLELVKEMNKRYQERKLFTGQTKQVPLLQEDNHVAPTFNN